MTVKLPARPPYNPMPGAVEMGDGVFRGRLKAAGYHTDGPDPDLFAVLRQWIPGATSWQDCPPTWRGSFLNLLPQKQPEVVTNGRNRPKDADPERDARVLFATVPEQPPPPIREYYGWSAAIDPPPEPEPEPEPPRPVSNSQDPAPAWTIAVPPRAPRGNWQDPTPGDISRAAAFIHDALAASPLRFRK